MSGRKSTQDQMGSVAYPVEHANHALAAGAVFGSFVRAGVPVEVEDDGEGNYGASMWVWLPPISKPVRVIVLSDGLDPDE